MIGDLNSYSYSSESSVINKNINLDYILESIKTGRDNKQKDEEYKILFNQIPFLFFNPIEFIKQSPEEEKNKYSISENFLIAQKLNNNNNIETLLQIISYKEKQNFYQEEDIAIPKLINHIQNCQKNIYIEENQRLIEIYRKMIEFYLFLIYLIIKNYPFYITKREYLEKYYIELSPYKNWPIPTGTHGFNIYKCLINELYLPGITILNEIRKKYLLNIIDPNRFILVRDDFLRYYFITNGNIGASKIEIAIKEDPNNKINAFNIFSTSHLFKQKKSNYKSEAKTIQDFHHLTIIHLIIFNCQQFMSQEYKISQMKLRKVYEFYSKAIPEYKTKEGFNEELLTMNQINPKRPQIQVTFEKNLTRNTSNKSLLNSFLNIIDEGINTDYYKDFRPLIQGVKKKLEESCNSQEGNEKVKILNLRRYLKPKIEFKRNIETLSFIEMYRNQYLNIEDKYMSHISSKISYENYKISPQDKIFVDHFNNIVLVKKQLIQRYIELRLIIEKNDLDIYINKILKEIEVLKELLNNKKEQEIIDEIEKTKKEKEDKEKTKFFENLEKNSNKIKDKNILNEKRKFQEKNILYIYSYGYLREQNDPDLIKIRNKRENNALPNIDDLINSVIIYYLGNYISEILTDFISRNDFVYYYLVGRLSESDNSNKLIQEMICIYLSEAKNFFYLNVYQVTTENNESFVYYFYSYITILTSKKNAKFKIQLDDNKFIEKTDIRKIVICNIAPKSSVKLISNENSGILDIYLIKDDIKEKNEKIFDKILSTLSKSESFKSKKIQLIDDTFIIENHEGNIIQENIRDIKIEHAYYMIDDKKIDFNIKIATFAKI